MRSKQIHEILQKGVVVIPKSLKKERITKNANVFYFTISAKDMIKLESFNVLSVIVIVRLAL